jgi:transposase-like protein
VKQAAALLLAADGVANEAIARSADVDADTVRRWRRRLPRQELGELAKSQKAGDARQFSRKAPSPKLSRDLS